MMTWDEVVALCEEYTYPVPVVDEALHHGEWTSLTRYPIVALADTFKLDKPVRFRFLVYEGTRIWMLDGNWTEITDEWVMFVYDIEGQDGVYISPRRIVGWKVGQFVYHKRPWYVNAGFPYVNGQLQYDPSRGLVFIDDDGYLHRTNIDEGR